MTILSCGYVRSVMHLDDYLHLTKDRVKQTTASPDSVPRYDHINAYNTSIATYMHTYIKASIYLLRSINNDGFCLCLFPSVHLSLNTSASAPMPAHPAANAMPK